MTSLGDRGVLRSADRIYRRGLVLGLTVAEVFLLLLFLLLLALAATLLQQSSDRRELASAERELEKLPTVYRELWVVEDGTVDPMETLIKVTTDNSRLRAEVQQLGDDMRPLGELRQRVSQLEIASGWSIDEIWKVLMAVDEDIEKIGPLVEQGRSYAVAELEVGRLQQYIEDTRELVELGERARRLERESGVEMSELEDRGGNLREDLDTDANSEGSGDGTGFKDRGADPPCWYREEIDESGERKEKQIPLFDVAVFDEFLQIRDPVNLERDTSERESWPLEEIIYMKEMADDEFLSVTEEIWLWGKEMRVQSYSCLFYVRILDCTSETSKRRWKDADDTIAKRFSRYYMRNYECALADDFPR